MTSEEYQHEVRKLRPQLLSIASRYFVNTEQSEDIVQEVMLRLWNMCDELHRPLYPLGSLMVKNLCVDAIRRRPQETDIGIMDMANDDSDDENNARIDRMMALIDSLPDLQKTLLRLRHINGLTNAELAKTFGINEEWVRKSLSRARKTVRNKYKH
jgi:RNA polymerase sigma factor (sigma-70 family)